MYTYIYVYIYIMRGYLFGTHRIHRMTRFVGLPNKHFSIEICRVDSESGVKKKRLRVQLGGFICLFVCFVFPTCFKSRLYIYIYMYMSDINRN